MSSFELQQRQIQVQKQTLSQKQIQSLSILSLNNDDLKTKINEALESNAFLTATDKGNIKLRQIKEGKSKVGTTSSSGQQQSDKFQSALEQKQDERSSLHEHLKSQLNLLNLSSELNNLCKKIIDNLNPQGFHIYSTHALLESNQSVALLNEALNIVQNLDPEGCGCKDTYESLYIQAKNRDNPDPLSLFILNGHFDFLNPPVPSKIKEKIIDYVEEQNVIRSQPVFILPQNHELETLPEIKDITEENILRAISFIKTLNPHPASNFGTEETTYISWDIKVKRNPEKNMENQFIIEFNNQDIPELKINSSYEKYLNSKDQNIKSDYSEAVNLIQFIEERQRTLNKAAEILVNHQKDFFLKGPGNLKPFTQKQMAELLEVNESTVSRIANDKRVQCDWGMYPFKYFFSNAVSSSSDPSQESLSKDNVKNAIMQVLEEHKNDTKKLSDQKIADILLEKGIKVARRTVSKYRTELNIDSSYTR